METSLFDTVDYTLTEINMEDDPLVDSGFTLDLNYARLWNSGLIKPLSSSQIKKCYEKIEKKVEDGNRVHFAVREKKDRHLIGFLQFDRISWSHSVARLTIGIGDEMHQGIAETQLLELGLKYAFRELNLFRVEMNVPEYSQTLCKLIEQTGFKKEVIHREVLYQLGRYWDEYLFGLLKPEWENQGD